MKNDLKELGEIKKEPSGVIKLADFMQLFKLVTKHAKAKISKVKQSFAEERRKALDDKNEEEY